MQAGPPPTPHGLWNVTKMEQQTIGKYRILEEIASGSQGTVYRPRDTSLNRVVALKVLHPHLSSDASILERFRREAQMAASVTHPNITQIFEVDQDGDRHFISMEYLPLSIHNLIQSQGRLPIDRASAICLQTAAALQAANHSGIVHRDIKPQNLLLAPDGTVKVTDFGIARAASLSTMTQTGALMGTPHYMSPEQARGQTPDIRSDLYSLGIVLYQMLTGQVPFQADIPLEVMRQHSEVQPTPVRQRRGEVPVGLEQVVMRCLEKRPERRYQTPDELARALRVAAPGPGRLRRQVPPFPGRQPPQPGSPSTDAVPSSDFVACPRCGHPNPANFIYCSNSVCLAQLYSGNRFCMSCGAQMPVNAKFCPECGHGI